MTRARYLRQMLVSEIGEAGQAKLSVATARVSGRGLSHEIASAYAVRAGVGTVVPGDIEDAAPSFVVNPAARAVVAGARAALTSLRNALAD